MHLRDGIRLPVVAGVSFSHQGGRMRRARRPVGRRQELDPEDALRQLCRRCRPDHRRASRPARSISPRASPRTVLAVRRDTIGYVSQFLRTVPRVSALDVVAEPLVARGEDRDAAREQRARLAGAGSTCRNGSGRCRRRPSPAASSSASTSRAASSPTHPVLLLDEPTASLDASNRDVVVELIAEKKAAGVALLGIFHDADVREAVADRIIDVTAFRAGKDRRMSQKLSETPLVHETAEVDELDARPLHRDRRALPRVAKRVLGDYSYMMQDCGVWCADDRQVRQHRRHACASTPPTIRPGGRRCTISPTAPSDYWDDAEHESDFFDWRALEAGHASATTPGSATARPSCPASPSATARRSAPAPWCPRTSRPTRSSAACRQSRSASASTAGRPSATRRSPGGTGTTRGCARRSTISARFRPKRSWRSTAAEPPPGASAVLSVRLLSFLDRRELPVAAFLADEGPELGRLRRFAGVAIDDLAGRAVPVHVDEE